MRVKNFGFGMPPRMNELWDWVVALDAWQYCDAEPLSNLIKNNETIPPEIIPAIAEIISGERKQNKKAAVKLKVEARERMRVAGSVSTLMGLIDALKYDVIQFNELDNETQQKGVVGIACRKGTEPLEEKIELEEEAQRIKQKAADEFGVSAETIENLLRDLREKIKAWPSV